MLDLSQLLNTSRKICVRCRDRESSLAFLREMKAQYPDKCRRWDEDEDHFSDYVGYIDYFPYLNNIDGNELLWDKDRFAENHGYKIVEYYDIPGARLIEDFGDIQASELDIYSLF